MKMQLVALALLAGAVGAGPALAQGTFSPGAPKSSWAPPRAPGYTPYVPPKPAAPKTSTYQAPKASTPEPFKPYEPYKTHPGTSLFGPDGKPKH